MSIWEAIWIAIVEGLTEYLPVSSTGHIIITEWLLGIAPTDFTKLFTVAVQSGAIMAVLVLYWQRFVKSWDFYIRLLVAFIPTAILGLMANSLIEKLLENVFSIAVMLVAGGIVLLFLDKWFEKASSEVNIEDLSYPQLATIGLFQSLAMFPGVSRSAASIVGGLVGGLNRAKATEFSFFLGVPTIGAATLKELYEKKDILTPENVKILGVGSIVGYFVAILAIQFFIDYISKNGFKVFGWYRIAVGTALLIAWAAGANLQL